MFEQDVVFVDIETNGGNGERGRIIEVAALKVSGGEIVDSFVSFVQPGSDIPHWITSLTGIKNSDLAQAPYFDAIAAQLFEFMQGCLFVAHNVMFDYSFLKREFKAAGYDFKPKLFCTVRMSRALYPEHKGHSLEKIIARHHIAVSARHRAYDDAKALHSFVQVAIEEKGFNTLQQNIALQLKTKTLPPNVDEAVIKNLPDSPGIYIFEDDKGLPLYVGKSINIRARVRSHFANATTIAKEMKMSLQSHNISYEKTDTEIEALLLESAKVKELQPLFNRLLRRKTKQSILVKSTDEQGYLAIAVENHDLSDYADLKNIYGVYQTKTKAKASLESIARTYQLCPKLLGLEKAKGACFRYQLGLCKGACIGKESRESYNQRLELALERSKIETWPFASKIAVTISDSRSLVIDQWVIQGVINHDYDAQLEPIDNSFDIDTYKILRTFLRTHKHQVHLFDSGLSYGV